jgi:hypothetical protein
MRPRSHLLTTLFVAGAVLLAPAAATAQVPTTPAAPAPQKVKLSARVERVSSLGYRLIALQGQRIKVRVVASPLVAGEAVTIRVAGAGGRLLTFHRTLRKVSGHGEATVDGLRASTLGTVKVTVTHAGTANATASTATARSVYVIQPVAGGGANGLRVLFLQSKLSQLGYLVNVNGYYDESTQRAVIAFRKTNRLERITNASMTVYSMLARGDGAYRVVHPDDGRHVEADLSRQILVLINPGGRVYRIIHMSSGASGTPTVRGGFRFYSKDWGTNAKGMVDSSYFIGGFAIHGYHDVPTYNASHGCLRIPIPNASFVFHWIRLGMKIDVYGHA